MKTRFNTYDIMCMVTELQKLVGMRVNQVYDIDSRTYVIRLQQSEEKCVLLLESANRFHTTQFEWPKNVAPSGFTMKLRKHLKNKRLEKLSQLGIDRIIDLQFGSGEAAYHVILELYDRGNIVLTDYEWTILNVLRPHVEGDKVRFAVKEKYPLDRAKTSYEAPNSDTLKEIISKAKPGDTLKKILNPNLEYGSSIIDHVLLENGLAGNMKIAKDPGKGFLVEQDLDKLVMALKQAERLLDEARTKVAKGYITQKQVESFPPEMPTFLFNKEDFPKLYSLKDQPHVEHGYITQKRLERPSPDGPTYLLANEEFHPMLYSQLKDQPRVEHETFDRAVDEFFSALEGQKIDMKTVALEREAMKKLQNVRSDHEKRVGSLVAAAASDTRAAELVSRNQELVEHARTAIQAAIANQMSWDDIQLLVKTAQDNKDPVASCIRQLKLDINHVTLLLSDPYHQSDDDEDLKPMLVDIDLGLTAYANARRYYDQKRNATKKQQKTLESAGKALKSAERKTKQTLKEAHTVSNIIKARKTYWFEKFYWFISSDNYLVIGGRDQQQNELLVKRYMRARDVYVHGEVTGAASVIVRNDAGAHLPPRTLDEAGHAAVAYSVAWEAKVVTRAWWVWGSQVSKSAPTGEYLTTGSFMIRGKKNYLLCNQLSFGFSFMFRLEDSCIDRHRDDRKPIAIVDSNSDVTSVQDQDEEQEIVVSDDGEDSEKEDEPQIKKEPKLASINEESSKQQNIQDEKEIDKAENNITNQDNVKSSTEVESNNQEVQRSEDEDRSNQIDNKSDQEDVQSDEEVDRSNREVNEVRRSEEKVNEEGSEDSEDDILDTHVKVDHGTGEVILQSKTRTISEVSDRSEDRPLTFPSLPKKPNKKSQKQKSEKSQEVSKSNERDGPKRGQKGKMKRIKQKYKDQDEEDREIALQMLQSAKEEKEAKKSAKNSTVKGGKSKQAQRGPKIPQPAPLILEVESDVDEPEPEPEPEADGAGQDLELVQQLCGAPLQEDELLFAVPVVAPYSALHNYKYKVKLTPGTSKRGKAAKTAVQVFLRDKTASQREKDLLKAVKEENIARNFPGKVKLSAPALHKHKK